VPPDAPQADEIRCQQIADQMPVFRSRPFVAGCVYWTYQDYRVPGGLYVMGVVDADRKRRPSWYALRDEYAPVRIESVTFAPPSGDRRSAAVTLRTRGPLERDMPAYVLRGYHLHWTVTLPEEEAPFAEGTLSLPTLTPGSEWSGEMTWAEPESQYVLKLRVVRPTGFTVVEQLSSMAFLSAFGVSMVQNEARTCNDT
jgi:beta-glucuronidase